MRLFLPEKFKGSEGRAVLAALIGGLAMLLILLSELLPSKMGDASPKNTASDAEGYQLQLETRLEELISQMEGAGKTTVMLTLESSEEMIYAVDTRSDTQQSQQTHVLLGDGTALKETIYQPQVRGAAVLCEGGGDIRIAANITEMISALLDLPSNRICVEQRKQ